MNPYFTNRPCSDPVVRFWSKVDKSLPDSCWRWRGTINKRNGYGYFSLGRKGDGTVRAHRHSYQLANGPIPDGLCVCHMCDTPTCVNPAHLFLGTHADNHADKARKGRSIRGEQQHAAKLTAGDVLEIRASQMPATAVARKYGITYEQARNVLTRRHWRHI